MANRSRQELDTIKNTVLTRISEGEWPEKKGRSLFEVWCLLVHVRWCDTQDFSRPYHYRFSITDPALRADFELWICGDENTWYLVENRKIRTMSDHPNAHIDALKGDVIVTLDTREHTAAYASYGVKEDLSQEYCLTLDGAIP